MFSKQKPCSSCLLAGGALLPCGQGDENARSGFPAKGELMAAAPANGCPWYADHRSQDLQQDQDYDDK